MNFSNRALLIFVLGCFPITAWSQCPLSQAAAIFYINGVHNDPIDAETSREVLQDKIVSRLLFTGSFPVQCVEVDLAYNTSEGLLLDLFQAVNQLSQQQDPSLVWLLISRSVPVSLEISTGIVGTLTAFDNTTYVEDVDLQQHLQTYRSEIPQNKVILVAHSQGNLYANNEYDQLISELVDPQNLAVVSIATPANRVAGSGAYTTLFEDWIWNLPGALVYNTQNSPLSCFTPWGCHAFIDSYLDGASSGPKILGQIEAALPVPPTSTFLFVVDSSYGNPQFALTGARISYDSNTRVLSGHLDISPSSTGQAFFVTQMNQPTTTSVGFNPGCGDAHDFVNPHAQWDFTCSVDLFSGYFSPSGTLWIGVGFTDGFQNIQERWYQATGLN